MARNFLPCIIALPVLLASWLTFSAPVPTVVAPDQLVAFDYSASQAQTSEAGELVEVSDFAE